VVAPHRSPRPDVSTEMTEMTIGGVHREVNARYT
jgi:hypothetical protein